MNTNISNDLKKVLLSIKNNGNVRNMGAGWTLKRINDTMTIAINCGFLSSKDGTITDIGLSYLKTANKIDIAIK